jgi:hypothetical protein
MSSPSAAFSLSAHDNALSILVVAPLGSRTSEVHACNAGSARCAAAGHCRPRIPPHHPEVPIHLGRIPESAELGALTKEDDHTAMLHARRCADIRCPRIVDVEVINVHLPGCESVVPWTSSSSIATYEEAGWQNRVKTQEKLYQPVLTKARILFDNCRQG